MRQVILVAVNSYKGLDNFQEELLFYLPLESLKWENCIFVSFDGALSMLGYINGFLAFVKKITQISKLLTV